MQKRLASLLSRPSNRNQLNDEQLIRLAVKYNPLIYVYQYARIPSISGNPAGDKFSFRKFPYMFEIYSDAFPNIVIQKALQVGVSEYAILKSIHACDKLGCDVMYGFPHSRQIGRFSKTRIARIISRSEYFREITNDKVFGERTIQSIFLRMIKGHYFYLVGVASESEIQSESVDLVVSDEFDLMDQDNAQILRKRNYSSNKRMYLDLGFPLIDGGGINAEFIESDQREYEVKCPKCETWQEIQWPRNVNRNKFERVCWKCSNSLEQSLRDYRWGRWIQKKPELVSVKHGYHISRLLYPDLDMPEFLKNADKKSRELEFYVYDLGLPYTGKTSHITDLIFASIVDDTANLSDPRLSQPIYGGADIGNIIYVWLEKRESYRGKNISRLIDLRKFEGENKFEKLAEYIAFAQPVVFCIDIMPETSEVKKIIRRFPMMVWGLRFMDFTNKPQEESVLDYDEFVVNANRTFLLDINFDDFLKRELIIPGEAVSRNKELKEHFKAPVQTLGSIGRSGVPIKRWVTPLGREDHWVFARAACLAAERIENWVKKDGGREEPSNANEDISFGGIYRILKRRI